jgi:hypothetical protein
MSLYQLLTPVVALAFVSGGLGLEIWREHHEPAPGSVRIQLSHAWPVQEPPTYREARRPLRRWLPAEGLMGHPSAASEGYVELPTRAAN